MRGVHCRRLYLGRFCSGLQTGHDVLTPFVSSCCLASLRLRRSFSLHPRVRAQSRVTSHPPATFTLANGLQVVVIPDHRTPVVTHMVWYKVGSADETPGKSGLAHFLEHLMFKGTSKNPAGEFSKTVAAHRRSGERLHLERLHRLFSARRRATSSAP